MNKNKVTNTKKMLGRQRGVTLIEVIVVMAISTILIMIAGLGIGTFLRKYKELSAWAELQNDAMECLNTIKNGVPVGQSRNLEYYGVTNAMKLELPNTISNTAQSIMITPPANSSSQENDFANFYLYDGAIRCRYRFYGVQTPAPIYLFPKQENLETMSIDKFQITKINSGKDVLAIQVELNARVKTGRDSYRQVKFKTKMVKK